MTPTANFAQPSLADLTARFLARPSETGDSGEFEPHEVSGGFLTDARTAWTEAVAVAKAFGIQDIPTKVPTDWSSYVRTSVSERFLPMALGHFPQQVRDIAALIVEKPMPLPAQRTGWTPSSKAGVVHELLAVAAARSAGNFPEAERLLDSLDQPTDEIAKALIANERASLAWQRGDRLTAVALWKALPDSGPVLFNRGMAALAEGRKADAAKWLARAVDALPESEGWHHLAKLYLALAR